MDDSNYCKTKYSNSIIHVSIKLNLTKIIFNENNKLKFSFYMGLSSEKHKKSLGRAGFCRKTWVGDSKPNSKGYC